MQRKIKYRSLKQQNYLQQANVNANEICIIRKIAFGNFCLTGDSNNLSMNGTHLDVAPKGFLKSRSFINRHSRHRLQFTLASVPYWLIWIHEKNETSQDATQSHVQDAAATWRGGFNTDRLHTTLNDKRGSHLTKQRFVSQLFSPLFFFSNTPTSYVVRISFFFCNVYMVLRISVA
jgi:hypothetical protein